MKQYTYEPHKDFDKGLEASVLGVLLLYPDTFSSVYNLLNADCFYYGNHEMVFRYIEKVYRRGLPIDLVTVTRAMYDAGIAQIDHTNTAAYLTELTHGVVSPANMDSWCHLLRELAAKRELIELTHSGLRGEDVLENAAYIEQRIKGVLDIRTANDWRHISQVGVQVGHHLDEVEAARREGRKLVGITTSIPQLDMTNGGFRPGMIVVLGARPGVGKSALMGQMIVAAAKGGAKVGVISLEMEARDVMQRMASAHSGVPHYCIDRAELDEGATRSAVYGSLAKLAELPIFFSDATQVNMHDIRAKAEKLQRTQGLDILYIDYLQLVEPESSRNRNREQEVSMISRSLKLLAMHLKIPIVILAQLNREAADKEPELWHLRESGSIEQDADVVMFLHRHREEHGHISEEGKLLVRKWRNGCTLDIAMRFEKEMMRWGG